MYKRFDATTQHIKDFLRVRPRRFYELRKLGVSVHRMNTLELQGVVFAERHPEHKTTTYYLLPEKLEKEGDGDGENVAIECEDTNNVSTSINVN